MSSKKKSGPTKRRRGRPVDADASGQRERLLAVAGEVFAEFGPHATRLQQIADRSGVDRKLIYHYFKSKDGLYIEVLRNAYGNLGEIGGQLVVDAQSVEHFMELLMRRFFAFCRATPAFVRILSWENLRDAQGMSQLANLSLAETVLQRLEPLVRQEIAAGRCRPDLDPRQLLVTGLGLCLYALTNRYSLRIVVGFHPQNDADWNAWIEHAIKQVVQGIRPATPD